MVKISGVQQAKDLLNDVRSFCASPRPMQGLVDDLKDGILINTALGKDYMGRSFPEYSKGYARKKEGATATGRPNLKRSGTMLGAVTAKVIEPHHGAVVVESVPEPGGKINADMLANIHSTGTGKQPRREFMNASKSRIATLTKKHYDDPILEIVKRSSMRGGS